jgi:RNA methyltransferase, TrmH family
MTSYNFMKTITSRANETVKEVCELHDSKGRKAQNQFIAEGIRTCSTLIKNGMKPTQLYVVQDQLADAQELIGDFFITVVDKSVMNKLSAATTPSGILGTFVIPPQLPFAQLEAGLVLAQINDPGNMGTLIRTAAAMNIKNIVVIEGADIWNPKVVQASAGALAYVNILTTSWDSLLKWKKNLRLCALVVKGGKTPQHLDTNNMLLIVGNEANGIPKEWLRQVDDFMTIPMPGKIESLNAAVAGSIALYLAFGKQ